MAFPTKNTSHVAIGLGRLVSRYQGQPNITKLLTSYLKEVQAAENMLWDVLTLRNIASGVGDQLDQIGKIVGQPRDGLDDTGYRVAIGLRILANRSSGRTSDVQKLAQALASGFTADLNGKVEYYEAPVYSFSVGVWNQTHPEIAASLFTEARAQTSRGVMHYSTWADGNDFEWGSRYDAAAGQGTWGSRYDSTVGGLYVSGRALS